MRAFFMCMYRFRSFENLTAPIVWLAIVCLGCLVYWVGLYGPFLFDDHGNLNWLGAYGEINSWDRFVQFYHSFGGGPSGRPISRLTFLLNSNNWPAEPFYFKVTNLFIHVLNGTLLVVVNYRLLHTFFSMNKRGACWVSIAGAAIWTLHPFLVSTVLYPVQRMAQMSSFFVLIGLVYYLSIRPLIPKYSLFGVLVSGSIFGVITLMAVLSKENGVLLPLLVGVIELSCVGAGRLSYTRNARLWLSLFILFPSLAVVLYLTNAFFATPLFDVLPPRDFSLYERLLTQPRILIDYLYNWYVPKLFTAGVFHDGFPKSVSIVQPLSTLISICLLVFGMGFAVACRKRYPLIFIALFFFLVGHILESSVVMLELYFEHRNYLPSVFLMLPLLVCVYQLVSRKVYVLISSVLVLGLSFFTFYGANIWSSYHSIVEASYVKAPYSPRASQQYSMILLNQGQSEQAYIVAKSAKDRIADSTYLNIWHIVVACKSDLGSRKTIESSYAKLREASYDIRNIELHELLIDTAEKRGCDFLSLTDLRAVYSSMLLNGKHDNKMSASFAQLTYLIGLINLKLGDEVEAEKFFVDSITARGAPRTIMKIAALFASYNAFEYALMFSNMAIDECCRDPKKKNSELYRDIRYFQNQVITEKNRIKDN